MVRCVGDPGAVGIAEFLRIDINPGLVCSRRGDGDRDRKGFVILLQRHGREGVTGLEGATNVRHAPCIISSCIGFDGERLAFRDGLAR